MTRARLATSPVPASPRKSAGGFRSGPDGPRLFAHFRDLPGRRGCRTCPPTCARSGSPRGFRPRPSSAPRCATAARDGGRPQRGFDLRRVRSAALSVPTPGRLLTNARPLDRVWGEDRRRRHGAAPDHHQEAASQARRRPGEPDLDLQRTRRRLSRRPRLTWTRLTCTRRRLVGLGSLEDDLGPTRRKTSYIGRIGPLRQFQRNKGVKSNTGHPLAR